MAQYIYGRNTVREKLNGDEVIEEAIDIEGYNKVEPTTETVDKVING